MFNKIKSKLTGEILAPCLIPDSNELQQSRVFYANSRTKLQLLDTTRPTINEFKNLLANWKNETDTEVENSRCFSIKLQLANNLEFTTKQFVPKLGSITERTQYESYYKQLYDWKANFHSNLDLLAARPPLTGRILIYGSLRAYFTQLYEDEWSFKNTVIIMNLFSMVSLIISVMYLLCTRGLWRADRRRHY